jgi:ribonuclease-3
MKREISLLEEKLGYIFKDQAFIKEALTHRSYKQPYNNERLEFLGDSILNFTIADYLFDKFPDYDEGALSKLRSVLVSKNGLYKIAEYFDLGEFLFLSNAEEKNNGRIKKSLLSNGVESIFAAIYLDSRNIDQVRRIIVEIYDHVYPVIDFDFLFKDYKTILQEITQAEFGVTPEYRVLSTNGPDHEKEFMIGVFIQEKDFGSAIGTSKKNAEQVAAKIAINKLDFSIQDFLPKDPDF